MTEAIPYPAPVGPLRQICPHLEDGHLSSERAEILMSQGLPWETVACHVQDLDWWRQQVPGSSRAPRLPWHIQSWDATLRLRGPTADIWVDPGPEAPLPDRAPNAVIATHAHYDHTAHLGSLSVAFPETRVVMSERTYELLSLRAGPDAELKTCLERRTTRMALGSERVVEGMRLTLLPAGHLLGAAMLELELGEDAILVTGDFAYRDVGGLDGAPWPDKEYSLVLVEATSVQQGRLPVADPRVTRLPFLQEVTDKVAQGKTRLLVNAQAMAQAQELYAALVLAQQAGAFPDLKVRLNGFAEVVSGQYYNALKTTSRVWHLPYYTVETLEVPPQSIVISSEGEDSVAARALAEAPDGAYIGAPSIYTHSGWAERMTWAIGVPSHAVGLYGGYSSSLHQTLLDTGKKVRALSQRGEEWVTDENS